MLGTARRVVVNSLADVEKEIEKVGTYPTAFKFIVPKGIHRLIKIEKVPTSCAHILKQEMLAAGGDAAVHRGTVNFSVKESVVLLIGTVKQLRQVSKKLVSQPFDLPKLGSEIISLLNHDEGRDSFPVKFGTRLLHLGERTHIMGIINMTPDSFSSDGLAGEIEAAVEQGKRFVEEGADILDVGGETARADRPIISPEEEIARVVPVIEALAKAVDIPISIDTYKSRVARAAIEAGATLLNDISGFKLGPEIGEIAAEYRVPLVIIHTLKPPKIRPETTPHYDDLMGEVIRFLGSRMAYAESLGVARENIILDPGIAFGKTAQQDLEIVKKLREVTSLGRPILLAPSKKRLVGETLNLPVEERFEGTAAAVTVGIMNGANIMRVHDVKAMVRVARMTDAILQLET
ncbi:MAG: dihydropteroate synthase [Candidatus Tectomicrobia bacterium]|nr:dihydropteroate synthase [Candidatus Tectomicrobia bacterium]